MRQRIIRYLFEHYNALFLCTFSVFYSANLYFFMLHFFHVAFFACCTFFILHHFHVALFCVEIFSCSTLFLCVALFHVALLHIAMFSFCILLQLHSSHAAIFSCCTLFMLHYFERCSWDHDKHLKWRALQQYLTKTLKIFLQSSPSYLFVGVLVTPLQKQPAEVFYEKRCSSKFHKVHRKAPVPGLFFNKAAGLRPATVL